MNLGALADIQMGYPFRSRVQHDPAGDVSVIQMKDIDDANLLHAEESIRIALPKGKPGHFLRAGDLLFRSRGRRNGVALVHEGLGPAVVSAPMLLIRPHSVLPAYLCWFLNAAPTQSQMTALAAGTSVRMISAEAMKALDVPLPSPAVQQRIVQAAELAEQELALLGRIAALRQRTTVHQLMKLAQKATP